jgi:hypothetical protein
VWNADNTYEMLVESAQTNSSSSMSQERKQLNGIIEIQLDDHRNVHFGAKNTASEPEENDDFYETSRRKTPTKVGSKEGNDTSPARQTSISLQMVTSSFGK